MPKRVKSETHMAQKLRYNARSRRLAYDSGSRWSDIDKELVLEHTMSDSDCAKFLGRSIQAIQACRYRTDFKKGGIYV